MKAAGLLHMLCVVPFLAGFAFQAFAAIVPSVPSKSASRPEGPVEPDNHAMTPDARRPVSIESSDRLTELQQQQPINYPMPEPPNEAAPFTLWLNSETGIDIRASNPFYPYALGKLVGSLYDVVFYWHASMYPDCGQNGRNSDLDENAGNNCVALVQMPSLGEIALDAYFGTYASGFTNTDVAKPTFIHLLAFLQTLQYQLNAFSKVVEHKKAFQQIWETQSSTGSDLRLVSWAVEAKIMDTIVQSVKARVDNQLNWLYGVVVTFIQLSPCNRNRDLRLYSDYLKTFIESELMASMPTCLKSANIELLSSSLVHEAEKTVVPHGHLPHQCKGFGASLSENENLREQFVSIVGTSCLKAFHQQYHVLLSDRADATIQQYNLRLQKYLKGTQQTISQ